MLVAFSAFARVILDLWNLHFTCLYFPFSLCLFLCLCLLLCLQLSLPLSWSFKVSVAFFAIVREILDWWNKHAVFIFLIVFVFVFIFFIVFVFVSVFFFVFFVSVKNLVFVHAVVLVAFSAFGRVILDLWNKLLNIKLDIK